MRGSKCDEYDEYRNMMKYDECRKCDNIFMKTFSFYEKVPFPFDSVALFLNIFTSTLRDTFK